MIRKRLPRGGGSPTGQLSPQCEWQKTTGLCIDRAEYTVRLASDVTLEVCFLHAWTAQKQGATAVKMMAPR